MQLFEKAVRALARAQGDGDWERVGPEALERYRDSVRAVLDALRDPDEVMAEAGAEIIRNVGPAESEMAHRNDAVTTWRFMIDALRGERG